MRDLLQILPIDRFSPSLEAIRSYDHVLTSGRYIGAEAVEEDGEPFEEKMPHLGARLNEQFAESQRLEQKIRSNLEGVWIW